MGAPGSREPRDSSISNASEGGISLTPAAGMWSESQT